MPYVSVATNRSVSKAKEAALVEILGSGIEVIPEKERANLFIKIEGDAGVYFGGNTEIPCAMVTVDLFGKSENEGLAAYSNVIRQGLKEVLDIKSANIYISYTECRHWGSRDNTNTAF